MLPTFVIGLREGLEAALIVGMVAAFLSRNDRRDALPYVFLGVGLAVALCVAVGLALNALERNLPQKPQEGLETVVTLVAVVIVTYMVFWMRRNARSIKSTLEGNAGAALASGSVFALVGMAFLAVLREGFETAVFLLAIFQNSSNPQAGGAGAVLGLALACVMGYGIYKGGVRIDLAKFFNVTSFLLIVVAAGLVSSSLHTAHEAGWIDALQTQAMNLEWLVKPGTVVSALVTGMLGIQPRPTVIESIGWSLYLVLVTLLVFWPLSHYAYVRKASPVRAIEE